jgi:predicted nucleic acid-binding protein
MEGKRPFFDSNVLLYAFSGEDDPRGAIAKRMLVESDGTISVQQLNEFVAVARRKLRRPWDEVLSAIEDLCLIFPDPIPITASIHKHGVAIAQRYNYRIYDSLVIAAAISASCDVLYSEDLHAGQIIQGVAIHNPF